MQFHMISLQWKLVLNQDVFYISLNFIIFWDKLQIEMKNKNKLIHIWLLFMLSYKKII